MSTLPNLACGVERMVEWAIAGHREENHGEWPLLIELHPTQWPYFILEASERQRLTPLPWGDTGEAVLYCGTVRVARNKRCEGGQMLTCNREWVPL